MKNNRVNMPFAIGVCIALGASLAAAGSSGSPPGGSQNVGRDFTKIAIKNSYTTWTMYYGAGSSWSSISGAGATPVPCEPMTFGGDPAPNVPKNCFLPAGHSVQAACAADFGTCNYSGSGTFVYGVLGKTLSKKVTGSGSLKCEPATFGGDPAPNIPKNCYFFPATNNKTFELQLYKSTSCLTAPAQAGAEIKPGACGSENAIWAAVDGHIARVRSDGTFTGFCMQKAANGNVVMGTCESNTTTESGRAQTGFDPIRMYDPPGSDAVKLHKETYCLSYKMGYTMIVGCDPAKKELVTQDEYFTARKRGEVL